MGDDNFCYFRNEKNKSNSICWDYPPWLLLSMWVCERNPIIDVSVGRGDLVAILVQISQRCKFN